MDTKGLQKEFINWCKSKNKQPKSEDETKQLFVAFMKEKHPEEYNKAVQNQKKQQQAQTQKALHGAKLNYFKSLKHQCAEDEEVVYYKKGGSVTCGCKKKEQGGEVKKDCGGSAIDKFKKMKSGKKITIKQQPLVNPNDTVHVNGIAYSVTNSDGSPVDKRFKPYSGKVEEEDRKKAKKGDKDAQKRQLKQDLASSEKCGGKVKKHQKGSVITQFKAYRKGGSLNRIPFMQAGTPKGGITRGINGEYYTMPIPYDAGRGPAGDSPMVLFDNPYIQGIMMAAGPIAGRKPGKISTGSQKSVGEILASKAWNKKVDKKINIQNAQMRKAGIPKGLLREGEEIVQGANGTVYVKLPNGNVQSVQNYMKNRQLVGPTEELIMDNFKNKVTNYEPPTLVWDKPYW